MKTTLSKITNVKKLWIGIIWSEHLTTSNCRKFKAKRCNLSNSLQTLKWRQHCSQFRHFQKDKALVNWTRIVVVVLFVPCIIVDGHQCSLLEQHTIVILKAVLHSGLHCVWSWLKYIFIAAACFMFGLMDFLYEKLINVSSK